MKDDKLQKLIVKIMWEVQNRNLTLKYGCGDYLTISKGNIPVIVDNEWLCLVEEYTHKVHYIDIETGYEIILD